MSNSVLSDKGRRFFWRLSDTIFYHFPHTSGLETTSNVEKARIKFDIDGKVYILTVKEKR